jgi:hypothetical protein
VAPHPSSKGMPVCGLSLACLTSIRLCHTHSCGLCYPYSIGRVKPFGFKFSSSHAASSSVTPAAVMSLLASRIPCFQGAGSQFNPSVLFARLIDGLKPCVCACTHAANRVWCAVPGTSALRPCTCGMGQRLLDSKRLGLQYQGHIKHNHQFSFSV